MRFDLDGVGPADVLDGVAPTDVLDGVAPADDLDGDAPTADLDGDAPADEHSKLGVINGDRDVNRISFSLM